MRKSLLHIGLLLIAWALPGKAAVREGGDPYMGVPFFRNYSASLYDAHNRNFDVICDGEGRTYFANFEGLLVYDNVKWRIVHTPDISRVVSLELGEDGNVVFESITQTGRVLSFEGDSIRVNFTEGNTRGEKVLSGGERIQGTTVDRWKEIEVYQRLAISPDRTLLATATDGVIAIDARGREVWRLNVGNGLCSNSVSKLAYDGKETVWGATDNGVFSISVSEIYTHFTEKEGLRGQISCIAMYGPSLMVGTFQGLFRLEGQRFVPVSRINQACWQMVRGADGALYVATSDGLYQYTSKAVKQVTTQFSLSIVDLPDGSFLVGELEHLSLLRPEEGIKVLANIPNITRFRKDRQGNVWAQSLSGDNYRILPREGKVEKTDDTHMSKLFEYEDGDGNIWRSFDYGTGVFYEGMPEDLKEWMEPFSDFTVQAMLVVDGLVWLGDNDELVRLDLQKCRTTRRIVPQLYMRSFNTNREGDLTVSFANDKIDPMGKTLYSYRLHADNTWSRWSEQQEFLFANLGYGNYQFSVRSMDAYGEICEIGPVDFKRPYPVFMRWYAVLLYVLLVVFLVYLLFRYRMRRMAEEQQRLEAIVDERTAELRQAQNKLLRQEREAAIGKLTKGLIDRILNPMNYINNFAHLSLGLSKDLRDNIEDEKENMAEDTYEDSVDVLDMLKTNLEKIEQHGISTTRTLKAMEEMLKDRSQKFESTDLCQLCQQCLDKFRNYFPDDIARLGVQVELDRPDTPVMWNVVPELMGKSISYMLSNSMYAVRKKADKLGGYNPVVKVTILQEAGSILLKIYDNGIGIEESIQDKIFDPFFTTKPTAEAPGVGLYLCQQIMHDCGGNITVTSVKDEYTEFVIKLA